MARTKASNETAEAAAEGRGPFEFFDLPGTSKNRIALNLAGADAIETDGPEHAFVYYGGIKHRIKTNATLEELAQGSRSVEE